MNAGIHQGYIKHLHRRQKETCITLCYVDMFWSEAILKTFVTLIRHKPIKVIVHIIASSSLQTLLFTYIYECSEKIHVCDVNAKCTNTEGSHTALHGWIITGISNFLKFIELADRCIRIYFCSSRNCSCKE